MNEDDDDQSPRRTSGRHRRPVRKLFPDELPSPLSAEEIAQRVTLPNGNRPTKNFILLKDSQGYTIVRNAWVDFDMAKFYYPATQAKYKKEVIADNDCSGRYQEWNLYEIVRTIGEAGQYRNYLYMYCMQLCV